MLQEDIQDIASTPPEGSRSPTQAGPFLSTPKVQTQDPPAEAKVERAKLSKHQREIRVHHSIHDRLQMETNLTLDLRPRSGEEHERNFKVDMYLFLPNSVGVNDSNFDSEEFFRHRTSYFRVRTPLYQQLRSIDPSELRIDSAESYFAGHLSSIERARLCDKVVQDVRLFGNFLHTELKKLKGTILGKRKTLREERGRELGASLIHRTELLWAFRERYIKPIREERYLLDEEVVRAFSLTDEYLSYRLELALLKAKDVLDYEASSIEQLLEREIRYRKEHGMLALGLEGQSSVRFEAYTYRLGLLKKYLGEVLFLQLTSSKKDHLYRNYAAAIGAGLAATIMGLAEHQRVQYLTGNDSGIRLAFLIGVAVLAYIFKDRVKELTKDYFNSRMKERLPDQRFSLSHESFTSEGGKKIRNLGTVSEYFRFLKKIPADISYLRHLGQMKTTDPERREHVVHIARRFRFSLRSKKHRKLFPLLKNVMRIDIGPFLSKLDNPTMPVSFVDEQGGAKTVQAPKVYHLNVVMRYEVVFDTLEGSRYVDYERFRLIVNKNGIVRLERVMEMGRLGYEVAGE